MPDVFDFDGAERDPRPFERLARLLSAEDRSDKTLRRENSGPNTVAIVV
jgi:hypothetical protein